MIEISNERMTLTVGDEVITTARFSQYAAADGSAHQASIARRRELCPSEEYRTRARNGTSSSTFLAASSPSATAAVPMTRPASTSTSAANSCALTRPGGNAGRASVTTSPPHHGGRAARLDGRGRRHPDQPRSGECDARPGRQCHRPPHHRRRLRHARLPRRRRPHRHHPGAPAMTSPREREPAITMMATSVADLASLLTTLDKVVRNSGHITAELAAFLGGRGAQFPEFEALQPNR